MPTRAQYIEQLREQQLERLTARQTHEQAITRVLDEIGTGSATTAQDDQLRAAASAISGIDAEIATLAEREQQLAAQEVADQRAAALRGQLGAPGPAQGGADTRGSPSGQGDTYSPARVGREERTYTRLKNLRGENSFFGDAYRMRHFDDYQARERLERHGREVVAENELSERALSTGGMAGLVIPQYLAEMAAPLIRAGRPVANAVRQMPLPSQGMSLIIPRGTGGAAVASQATENTAVQNTDESWLNLTVPVVTIAGQQDVSRQILERGVSGVDEIVYADLAAAYHAELDRQVLNGSGASGQMLGMLQTAGIATATAFGAAPTAALLYRKTAGAIAAVASVGAGIQPRLVIQHPRRWGWLNGEVDGQGRPLFVSAGQGPYNTLGINEKPGAYGGDGHNDPNNADGYTVVGSIQGLPIVTDANVPTNLGTNSEDAELIIDPAQHLLWEDNGRVPRQLRFEQTSGQSLTVKLVIYNYAAFSAGRYPGATARVGGADTTGGQGLIAPTF